MGAAFLLLTLSRGSPAEVYVASGFHGLGAGLSMAALGTLVISHVAQEETGAAAGINNVARTLGGAVGAQVGAVLLAGSVVAAGSPSDAGYTLAFGVGLAAVILSAVVLPLVPGRGEHAGFAPASVRAEAERLL
jgi:MFS family permease